MADESDAPVATWVYVIRHAHSPFVPNRERERGLSDRGRRDAKRVRDQLTSENIDVVVSSSYTRAVRTVEPLADVLGVEIEYDEGFRERRIAGRSVDDFETATNRLWDDPLFSFEGGESHRAAQERGVEALERLLDGYRGDRIAVGTHGTIMTLVMHHYDSRYDDEFWRELGFPAIYRFEFEDYSFREITPISISDR